MPVTVNVAKSVIYQVPNFDGGLVLFVDNDDSELKVKDYLGNVFLFSDVFNGSSSTIYFNQDNFSGDGTQSNPINVKLQTTGANAALVSSTDGLGVDLAASTLPTPTAANTWTYYKSDGVTLLTFNIKSVNSWNGAGTNYGSSSSSQSVSTIVGAKMSVNSVVTVPSAITGQSKPTGGSSASYTGFSPFPTVFPATFPLASNPTTGISVTTSYSATFTKPKSGLVVSGTQVVKASGNDSSTITSTVTFNRLIKGGYSTSNNANQTNFDALTDGGYFFSTFGTSMTFTLPKNQGITEYLVFAIPSSITITSIVQNGATPVLGAFTVSGSISITDVSGASNTYKFYISNNTGAFNSGDTLQFIGS